MTDRRKFVALYVMIITLLSVAVIGIGAWLIVPVTSNDTTPDPVADNSPAFISKAYFTGTAITPKLNVNGQNIFGTEYKDVTGDASATSGYRIQLVRSVTLDDTPVTGNDRGVVAGYHDYTIVDVATNQTICKNHRIEIMKAPAVIDTSSITPTLESDRAKYYHGDKANFKATLNVLAADDAYLDDNYDDYLDTPYPYSETSVALSGTVSYSGKAAESNATVKVDDKTFANYYIVDTSLTTSQIKVTAIAYNGATYYPTVYDAISKSTSGTVYVIPFATTSNGATENIKYSTTVRTLTADTTIASGLTVILPYSGTSYGSDDDELAQGTYSNAYSSSAKNTNRVFVAPSVTLTVNGTLNIGGVCNAGSGGKSMTGQTCNSYGMLTFVAEKDEEGNKTTVTGKMQVNGTVTCYGFIEGSSSYDSLVFNNGSKLTTPFVLYEFRGGTISTGMQKEDKTFYSCPFNRYVFPNIVGSFRINYGCTVNARAALSASALGKTISASAEASVIATSTSGSTPLLEMSNSKAYINLKYDPNGTKGVTYNGSADPFGKMSMQFYGGVKLNYMYIEKSILITKVTVSSRGAYLPIPYLYDIELYDGDYDFTEQNVKILPGGKLTVGAGANVEASNLIIYDAAPLGDSVVAAAPYPKLDLGQLIVNGTVKATNLGGFVDSGSSGANLNISGAAQVSDSWDIVNKKDAQVSELAGYTYQTFGDYIYASKTQSAVGNVAYGGATEETTYATGTNYVSAPDTNSESYAWAYDHTFTIKYETNGGVPIDDKDIGPIKTNEGVLLSGSTYLPTPSRDYHVFKEWYLDAEFTKPANGQTIYVGTSLYAKWEEITYTLNFGYIGPDGNAVDIPSPGIPSVQYSASDITTDGVEDDSILITLPENPPRLPKVDNPVNDGDYYTLSGWFDETGTPVGQNEFTFKKLTELAGSDNSLTLKGRWTDKFYNITFNLGENPYGLGDIAISNNPELIFAAGYNYDGDSTIYNQVALHNGITQDAAYNRYFAGWYVDEACQTPYTSAYLPDTEGFTLYAKWGTKAQLTVDYGNNVLGYVGESVYIMPNATYTLEDITLGDDNHALSKYSNGWTSSVSDAVSITDTTATLNCADAASITLTANWLGKVLFSVDYGAASAGTSFEAVEPKYYLPGTVIDISGITEEAMKYDSTVEKINKYFGAWAVTGNASISADGAEITLTGGDAVTITANWLGKVQLKIVYDHTRFTDNLSTDLWFVPGTESIFLIDYTEDVTKYDIYPTEIKYFEKWEVTDGNASVTNGTLDISVDATTSVTVTASWLEKTTTVIFKSTGGINAYPELLPSYGGYTLKYDTVYYLLPGITEFPLSVMTTYDGAEYNSAEHKYYFGGWTVNGVAIDASAAGCTLISDADNVLNIDWLDKAKFQYTADNTGIYPELIKTDDAEIGYGTIFYYKPGTTVALITGLDAYDDTVTEEYQYYFSGWQTTDGVTIGKFAKNLTLNGDTTVKIIWGNKKNIKVTHTDNQGRSESVAATYTITVAYANGESYYTETFNNSSMSIYVKPGDNFKFTNVSAYNNSGSGLPTEPQTVTANGTYDGYTIQSYTQCITPETLITLADGSQVRVDSLKGDELLLVWNLETGKLDFAPIMFVDSEAEAEFEVIKLIFSDGTFMNVIYEHGFWDYDLNKYVYLDAGASEYIGHNFAKQNGDKLEKVQLVDVQIETVVTTAWSPVTVGHLCYFVNGMLSMPGGVGGLFNIFEVDEDTMTYDYEAMMRDIETYGLFTYEELNAISPLSREMFEAAGGAYLKVSIGKGNLTVEELIYMIERYSSYFE
ncbi:MAG: InlB B-repeat-containing protein [Clostridia bacterium]|nr:InlB B-repeat-containing protein [Clostridia bacterium]